MKGGGLYYVSVGEFRFLERHLDVDEAEIVLRKKVLEEGLLVELWGLGVVLYGVLMSSSSKYEGGIVDFSC